MKTIIIIGIVVVAIFGITWVLNIALPDEDPIERKAGEIMTQCLGLVDEGWLKENVCRGVGECLEDPRNSTLEDIEACRFYGLPPEAR